MDQHKTFKCDSCGYRAIVSENEEQSNEGFTNVFICNDCNSLIDLSNEYNELIKNESIPLYAKNNHSNLHLIESLSHDDQHFLMQVFGISKCEHRHVEVWDYENRICPKCGCKMKESNRRGFLMWD